MSLRPARFARARYPSLPTALRSAACAVVIAAFSLPGRAQSIGQYFPPGVPGYGTAQGVTVLSRLHPQYDAPGVRVGDFVIRPSIDESFGYETNPFGFPSGSGSAVMNTSAAVSAGSQWSRDSLGASAAVSHSAYLQQPSQNYNDVTLSLGGGYTIGRSNLDVGYSYLSLAQTAAELGAIASTLPIHYTVNDLRSDYTFNFGRLFFVPNLDVSEYTFDPAVIRGVTTAQLYRDRVIATGGVTTQYELSEQHNLLFVLQGVESHYTNPQPGVPSNNSTGEVALFGVDYQANGVWRYRLLAGAEHRDFAAAAFKSRTEPVAGLSAIWTPTGLTTVTGSAARTIEQPNTEGSAGFIDNALGLTVDHEYLRNVLLEARVGAEAAQFMGGGSDTRYSFGAGVSWLLNRHVRLSANYDYVRQHGDDRVSISRQLNPVLLSSTATDATSGGLVATGVVNPATVTSGSFTDNTFLVALHFGL